MYIKHYNVIIITVRQIIQNIKLHRTKYYEHYICNISLNEYDNNYNSDIR